MPSRWPARLWRTSGGGRERCGGLERVEPETGGRDRVTLYRVTEEAYVVAAVAELGGDGEGRRDVAAAVPCGEEDR